jgi:predicted nucleic acid-binding protein
MVISNLLHGSKKIALDTNLFIYVFEQHPEFGEKAKAVLKQIEDGFVKAIASSVSLAEILVKPIREGNLTLEKQYKLLFSHFPNLTILPIDNMVAERAAYLRGKYNIKTPDALIVATALVANADLFITNDQRLEIVKEIKCISLGQQN